LHIVLVHDEVFVRTDHIAANLFRRARRILEISAHCFLNLLAAVHQPQHDEQRHHRRHEIRVRHFPRAAVMAAMPALLLDDDDWPAFWCVSVHCICSAYAAFSADGAAAPSLFLTCDSISLKVGRTWPGIARRANSMDTLGGVPFMKATITTRST